MEEHRDGDAGDHPVREQRVLVREPRRLPRIRDGVRSPRLRRDPDRSAGRARAHVADPLRARAPGCADDEVVVLEQAQNRCVGVEESRRLADDLLEGRNGVELRGEEAADVGEALREGVRPPLALEELGALERAARRSGEVPREREVVVGEAPFLAEEDDDGVLLPLRADHRCGDQRPVALVGQERSRALLEAVVVFERGR